jgi:hypothetical protein
VGAGNTLMIACCSPSEQYLTETLSTLQFATKAANISKRAVNTLTPHEAEASPHHFISFHHSIDFCTFQLQFLFWFSQGRVYMYVLCVCLVILLLLIGLCTGDATQANHRCAASRERGIARPACKQRHHRACRNHPGLEETRTQHTHTHTLSRYFLFLSVREAWSGGLTLDFGGKILDLLGLVVDL